MSRYIELASGMTKAAFGVATPWEHSIRRFERMDRVSPPGTGCVVFVGSSSFTLWSSLERDMAPLPALNRGFGGALIDDVVRYLDRIVLPYSPAALVVFAGTNDIAGRRPATADYVEERFLALIDAVHSALPRTLTFYVAITPSPARWPLWPIAQDANERIRKRVDADDRLRFIDLGRFLLGSDGLPDRRLYRRDGLHPCEAGYRIWGREIRAALLAEPALTTAGGASVKQRRQADAASGELV